MHYPSSGGCTYRRFTFRQEQNESKAGELEDALHPPYRPATTNNPLGDAFHCPQHKVGLWSLMMSFPLPFTSSEEGEHLQMEKGPEVVRRVLALWR